MCSEILIRKINKMVKEFGSNQISILTSHLKIEGSLYECQCDEDLCSRYILNLKDALVCNLSDYCACDGEECECNDYVCFKYDWLNLNASKIVAFSIIR